MITNHFSHSQILVEVPKVLAPYESYDYKIRRIEKVQLNVILIAGPSISPASDPNEFLARWSSFRYFVFCGNK